MAIDSVMLDQALAGSPLAVRRLTEALMPVVHFRAARQLMRLGTAASGRDVRQEVEDMVQDIFYELFRDDARRLRSWDPTRGLSLENYVGMIAEQRVIATLRSGRRSPWTDQPAEAETLDAGVAAMPRRTTAPTEAVASDRERLTAIVSALQQSVSPTGFRVFEMLFVEQAEVEEVCAELGMQPGAVYTWRSRLRAKAAEIAERLDEDMGALGRRLGEEGA